MSTFIIRKNIRPNTSVNFYEDISFKEYVLENWILTNKMIVSKDISDDGLVETLYMEFPDDATREEWQKDPRVITHREARDNHNINNNIRIEIVN